MPSMRLRSAEPARQSGFAEAGVWARPRVDGLGRWLLAGAFIGLGILGLVTGDFAAVWQRIPIDGMPGQTPLALACGALELALGIGLLLRSTLAPTSTVLVGFLLLWAILLKLPAVIWVPQMLATWLGLGEILVILAGAWILFAANPGPWAMRRMGVAVGERGIRHARLLFALALPTIGLSHFVYSVQTAALVPPWLPDPVAWAYLTGAGNLAACVAILFGVMPRLAATLEALMLAVITVLVWMPGVSASPTTQFQATGFLISAAIAAGAWIVADSYRDAPWLSAPRTRVNR
ncbi:MAG: DoxX family membrane protein [Rudaea sp.]